MIIVDGGPGADGRSPWVKSLEWNEKPLDGYEFGSVFCLGLWDRVYGLGEAPLSEVSVDLLGQYIESSSEPNVDEKGEGDGAKRRDTSMGGAASLDLFDRFELG